ncbi:MAG: FAD-dependent oxidoreductase [Deltaproteobacteria bacterium]|nr:FAD-dependent oxidoreductase [Deltaproteobacteria bacterium]
MAGSTRFQKLLEPGYIGSIRTKNHILKTGSTLGFYPWEDGNIQQAVIDSYEAIAKGGAGLVTVGGAPLGVPPGMGYKMDDDKYLPSMTRLAESIRKYDCPAFVQMFHLGPMLPPFLVASGQEALAASSMDKSELPLPTLPVSRELTVPEIEEIVQEFGNQAERIKKAGFQGIELNAGCNHLLNSFLSRAWNKRQDAYGIGSIESRAKIVVDIIKEIKRRNGKDFAIIALINGAEPGLEKSITPEESQGIAKALQEAGADAIHVRAEFYSRPKDFGLRDSTQFPDIGFYPDNPYPDMRVIDASRHGVGGWVPLAAVVKKAVSVPVITVGRLDPELGEEILRRGMADFITFNRRLMADHDLPNKLAEGRLEDIRPCTGCTTCFDNNEHGNPPLCQVNASIGKEKEYEIKPAQKKKRVMIVGGGPAGMETARVAALREHEVILYEKEPKLGGSMLLAAMVKGFDREDILGLVGYFKIQINKLGVDVRLGKEVNRSVIEEVKPDVLVIAAGGAHDIPEIPGIDRRNVVTSCALHRRLKSYQRLFGPKVLRWLTQFWMPIGKRVVIMGGNIQGCQTAEFLVRRGRKVTIVDTTQEIGDGLLEMYVKPHLLDWLDRKGVTMMPGVKYEEITDKGLTITNKEGKKQTIEADTIVTAMPLLPNTDLLKSLEGSVPELYAIGDCKEPKLIVDAIGDGSRIARAI